MAADHLFASIHLHRGITPRQKNERTERGRNRGHGCGHPPPPATTPHGCTYIETNYKKIEKTPPIREKRVFRGFQRE